MDGLAAGFSFQGASVIVMKKNEGFGRLAMLLKDGIISVRGYKAVFILLGQGEVWDTDKNYFSARENCLMEIEKQDDKILIILGASLPSINDSRPMVGTFVFRNDKMAVRCGRANNLEHARPGKNLLTAGGPIPDYFDEYGNLNESGLDVIGRAIEHKLDSLKVLLKIQNLRM